MLLLISLIPSIYFFLQVVGAAQLLQLLWEDLATVPGELRDVVSPACSAQSPGRQSGGIRRHPDQIPEPPQLVLL